jgi:restriction system protein
MTGIEFEEYLKAHFEKKGYKVESTSVSNDYGADLILIKGGVKTVVQVKRYRGKIGNSAIQEVVGAAGYYKADKCIVVTNSLFTENSKNLAAANNVELWDRYRLIDEFNIHRG